MIFTHMMSFKNCRGSGYNIYFRLLTISYQPRVSYLKRSGVVGERKTTSFKADLPYPNKSARLITWNLKLIFLFGSGREDDPHIITLNIVFSVADYLDLQSAKYFYS
jgi:hypothetical protein